MKIIILKELNHDKKILLSIAITIFIIGCTEKKIIKKQIFQQMEKLL